MGKISPVAAKYIVHAVIEIEGVVDRPDVIGAIFGQTEGLLGADLELRELQKSGRIGRIEVNTEVISGKTKGTIDIPSSMDKAETAIIAAALEIIQRIGPCNAKLESKSIEDVRISKRTFVIERAKELLRGLMNNSMPDSQELADEVAQSVRIMEIVEYGKDRLPAGPSIDESEEILIVEGRADVLNLLKHGIKNAVAMNGTSVPETIIELCGKKVVTAFVDGDRGGNLIVKELTSVADIDFVCRAPDGKEVEEITLKEIHKALRTKVSGEQAKQEIASMQTENAIRKPQPFRTAPPKPQFAPLRRPMVQVADNHKQVFKEILENLVGTRGAQVLDQKLNTLGKVPLSELQATLKSLNNAGYAVLLDGSVDRDIAKAAEMANMRYVVGMDSKVRPGEARITILTVNDL